MQSQRRSGDSESAKYSGECDGGRALDVIVETADALSVTLKETDRVIASPVLELDERPGELGLDRRDELVDKGIELVVGDPSLLETQIQRVSE